MRYIIRIPETTRVFDSTKIDGAYSKYMAALSLLKAAQINHTTEIENDADTDDEDEGA